MASNLVVPTEGGDVVLFHNKSTDARFMFIGISHPEAEHERSTTEAALPVLATIWPYRIVPVGLAPSVLHLDLVFNILPTTKSRACVVNPQSIINYESEIGPILEENFDHIVAIDREEEEAFVCNFLNIGPGKLIMSKDPDGLTKSFVRRCMGQVRERLEVFYVEHHVSAACLGGGVRCSTLAIDRGDGGVWNETDPLRKCLVGIWTPYKKTPLCRKAVEETVHETCTKERVSQGIHQGLEEIVEVLEAEGVEVVRPRTKNKACNVIYCRDIALQIGTEVYKCQQHLPHRQNEFEASFPLQERRMGIRRHNCIQDCPRVAKRARK
jgi:N-dimethylarginine dimethylaminohydrolase